ncbi:hypothetical protein ESOMN_v1c00290 [Williamsoniiplasma somnilux]|uniref:Beta-lactamase-related domain-containing protein n=1 Tax=Williamsoniiplasma somnilux TaxID=215578 RepID=A0A2K8NX42_9MOLU|nr:serine hydrolase domain-containing protein [Williamsoniiplasma somnilux]ATZ18415.1 hypothetical protein ESOMN_v1c00290 [Williamsoniiplasma somnilux]
MKKFKNSLLCLQKLIDEKYFNGAVLCVYKDGNKIFDQAIGYDDYENKRAMSNDLIFRAYSMTKPVTVIAAFICIQKGLFELNDPISKFIPEFLNTKVLIDKKSTKVKSLENPITIKHLLTMTSGITYFGNKNETQRQTTGLLRKLNDINNNWSLQDFAKNLAALPLLFEPGTDWNYGLSLDLMGAVIEKASNLKFNNFCKKYIFEPLDLKDTNFYVFDKEREANIYKWENVDGKNLLTKTENFKFLMQTLYEEPPAIMGGSGLFATASDYAKLMNIFLGKYDVLEQKNIDQILSDQIPNLHDKFIWTLNKDYTYGFGVRLRLKNELEPLTEIGEAGWDGYLGSIGIIDTKNNLTAALMVSSSPGNNLTLEKEFFKAFYEDIK